MVSRLTRLPRHMPASFATSFSAWKHALDKEQKVVASATTTKDVETRTLRLSFSHDRNLQSITEQRRIIVSKKSARLKALPGGRKIEMPVLTPSQEKLLLKLCARHYF